MTKKKKCKECEGMGDECKCPKKSKNGRGWFGLGYDHHGNNEHGDASGGGDMSGGGMSEGIRMPKAPSDADKSMQGASRQRKEKTLSDFRSAADDAKKRQKYKDENDDLAVTRMKKGVRFYDKKGSGYLKGGKKTYD